MKISFIQTGKTTERYIAEGISLYENRIGKFVPFNIITTPALKNTRNMKPEDVKGREGVLLLDMLASDDYVILLDERGKEFTTNELASFIRISFSGLRRNIAFVCGGAWGFSQAVYSRADMRLSLSKLTFPHQLVRLLFMEQLYRVLTIIEGFPYHHE
jgi:23S rRNA (pseudouridine1915-N3)-methyltransferase